MAVFLVLPDTKRILNLFIFNRTAEPSPTVPFLKDNLLNRGVLTLQYLYCAASLALAFYVCYAPAAGTRRGSRLLYGASGLSNSSCRMMFRYLPS